MLSQQISVGMRKAGSDSLHIKQFKGVWEQGTEENIWTLETGSDMSIEKSTSGGAS